MKVFIILSVLAVVTCTEYYDSKYDSFNAQELVENDRLLEAYGLCFLSERPCTSEGDSFKRVIPESIKTNCAKCSPKQRELVRIVVKGFQEKLPDLWDKIINRYDSKGEYRDAFLEFINSSD